MKRSIIYLLFLSIGVTISCSKKVDCRIRAKFIFINTTNHLIQTSLGIIEPNKKLEYATDSDGYCEIDYYHYTPPFIGDTHVKINDTLCLIYKSIGAGRGEGVVCIENYQWRKIAERHYEFTYTFTEEEAKKATTCP